MEGIALAIYEAMAMGLVPVGADVGGQRELVTPECGVLLQRGSREEEVLRYADVLEELIKSPDRRDAMGKASRERVITHFELEQMGERMDHLLAVAQRLHHSNPRPESGIGLAVEHAVQAIEGVRILQAFAPLWKYQVIESRLRRLGRRLAPAKKVLDWVAFHLLRPIRIAVALYILRPIRDAKDRIWITGHRYKVRWQKLEETD
jgi:hypothetical protein